ncbi:MAG: alpha-2-macroglobulin, partial [Flavipsychrobacter sp.]|nr:alpha-2-macroglobulin [Flavipsychrobacter sp.]
SLQWQALKVYQQLLSLHSSDAIPDAFIDADLHRLEFVHRASILPDRKELYIKALENIEQKYSNHPLSALAAFRVVQAMLVTETTTLDIEGRYSRPRPKAGNYPEVKKRLEQIVATFPKSEGGALAGQLLVTIERKELSVQAEQVVLPGEPSKAVVMYRNTPKSWFRVVPVDIEEYRMAFRRGDRKWRETLLKTKPLKAWSENLPGTEDYNTHITEVKIDELPLGLYAILASSDEKFSTEQNIISSAVFQVSRLSLISQANGGYVLDRKTGEPVANASIEFYEESYKNGRYELIVAQNAKSGNDGAFSISRNDGRYSAFSVRKGDDVIYLNESLHHYSEQREQPAQTRTFFFTDRSIYRPGQTIYFKGIMVRSEKEGRVNNVLAGEQTEVIFYDANGQKIGSQKLTTNEFGSVSGSFTAPEGVLTGTMQISNNSGATHFSVEEYKRPKFSVAFDTIKTAYALNEKITVGGKTLAYAGNTIDNATVKFRVMRKARWPYWWSHYYWGMPVSNEMEITRGTALTDKDGKFTINFTAIPDKSIDPASLPVFNYTVYADVTDINGETRSGSQTISVGYTAIVLSANIPEKARPADLDTITIVSQNLNGGFVPATVVVRIDRLQQPATPLRKRLWATPDQHLMDSVIFKRFFPIDEYRNESEPMNWPRAQRVAERTITTTKEGQVIFPLSTWQENGWYAIELETTDNSGKKITEKKFVQVWDGNNQGLISDPLAVIPQLQTAEPGQKPEIHVASGYKTAHIIQQVQRPDKDIITTTLDYSGKPINWSTTITEADRGGIQLKHVMVKENRVYDQESTINVPYSNKELNISWETHRDKLLPGAKETWTMVVRGSKKEKVAAEMVAALYDASLDAFRPHKWAIDGLYPVTSRNLYWVAPGFSPGGNMELAQINNTRFYNYEKRYDELDIPGYAGRIMMRRQSLGTVYDEVAAAAPEAVRSKAATGNAVKFTPPPVAQDGLLMTIDREETTPAATEVAAPPAQNVSLRKDFRETAFFFPQLKTDEEGNIRMEFTLPEALTEWKLMTLAHTKDMSFGMFDGKVKTQKDLMVMPGLPRFLRQGDDIIISSKISNL